MKSLLEIQQTVRKLETDLQEMAGTIKNLNADIAELMSDGQDTEMDFGKIKKAAQKLIFGEHPISQIGDETVCRIYLEMLLNIIRLDTNEEASEKRLIFIQWLQMESGTEFSLKGLYKDSFQMDADSYEKMVCMISGGYRWCFIVDALIIANIGGSANEEICSYIAELAAVLEIDQETMKTLSLAARIALCQNAGHRRKSEIKRLLNFVPAFEHYVTEDIFGNIIGSMRRGIVELPDANVSDFEWAVKQGKAVRRGKVVARYFKSGIKHGWCNVASTDNGSFFHFKNNHTYYGVLSHENDDIDSIKYWIKTRN